MSPSRRGAQATVRPVFSTTDKHFGCDGAEPRRERYRGVETVPERMKQTEAQNGRKKITQGKRRNASAALGNQSKLNQAL
jgi:hypothetical protein